MHPLDSLPSLAAALRGAPVHVVREEVAKQEALPPTPALLAALAFGRGALALREGRSDAARRAFEEATLGFESAGELEAADLARCEGWLARIRRGATAEEQGGAGVGFAFVRGSLERLAGAACTTRVEVVARHYLGTAERAAGNLEATQLTLLEALARSEGMVPERAQILNSLGTVYVLTGAYGAATALLEHAADLARRLGDVVGEAIAFGQLGSVALAEGDREMARRHLRRQEWLAAQVGDAFGRARSLVLLGELALELERPDEALAVAKEALDAATSVDPPLAVWAAQASRIRGRARLELGEPDGAADLDGADERFRSVGNRLGSALVAWDRSRHGLADQWADAAWKLASLGLEQRLARLLHDRRSANAGDIALLDGVLASATQPFAHLAAAHELELLHRRPRVLALETERRVRAQRSLARTTVLALESRGLFVAALAHDEPSEEGALVPSMDTEAGLLGGASSFALWAWRGESQVARVVADLAGLRRRLPSLRVALGHFTDARVVAPPLRGESAATLEGVPSAKLVSAALLASPGELLAATGGVLDGDVVAAWDAAWPNAPGAR